MKKLLFLSLMVPSAVFGSDKISTYIENRFSGLETDDIAQILEGQINDRQKQISRLSKTDKNQGKRKRCASKITFLNAVLDQVNNKDREYSAEAVQQKYDNALTMQNVSAPENALIQKGQSILESMYEIFKLESELRLKNDFLFKNSDPRGYFDYTHYTGMGYIKEEKNSLRKQYLDAGGSEQDINKCRQEAREYVDNKYVVIWGDKTKKNIKVIEKTSVTQGQEEQKVVPKTNSSWKPSLFKIAGVTTFVGLTGWLTYNNKGRIVVGTDRLTNGAFSQYAAAAWNKVPVMPKFNFSRSQFSGFGSGVGLVLGNKCAGIFAGAQSYLTGFTFWNK